MKKIQLNFFKNQSLNRKNSIVFVKFRGERVQIDFGFSKERSLVRTEYNENKIKAKN